MQLSASKHHEIKGRHVQMQPSSGADVDVLYCEVLCKDMSEIQGAWQELKERVQRTPDMRIIAVRDGFAMSSGRRSGEVVLAVHGYLATVVFLEATLVKQEKKLDGLCRLAESIGLLDDVKPENWETFSTKPAKAASPCLTHGPQNCRLNPLRLRDPLNYTPQNLENPNGHRFDLGCTKRAFPAFLLLAAPLLVLVPRLVRSADAQRHPKRARPSALNSKPQTPITAENEGLVSS